MKLQTKLVVVGMNNWRFLSKIEGYNKFLSDFVQDIMEELLKLFIGLVPN